MKKPGLDVMIALGKPKPPAMKDGPGFPALKQPDGASVMPGDDEESEETDSAATWKRIEGKLDAIIAGLRDLGANIADAESEAGGDEASTPGEE